ncbi:hypothetical protein BGW38_001797 [Lunasporangiospora selenospora]|uniref:Transmembrane protein n=1 Tax=Lunasporangiospora selenospora TaxID=979761 RepID=A0A9P6FU45_9FUNG|nr:hypothetical protein BGW38_001797 [Lunasporangiospora selenospora]
MVYLTGREPSYATRHHMLMQSVDNGQPQPLWLDSIGSGQGLGQGSGLGSEPVTLGGLISKRKDETVDMAKRTEFLGDETATLPTLKRMHPTEESPLPSAFLSILKTLAPQHQTIPETVGENERVNAAVEPERTRLLKEGEKSGWFKSMIPMHNLESTVGSESSGLEEESVQGATESVQEGSDSPLLIHPSQTQQQQQQQPGKQATLVIGQPHGDEKGSPLSETINNNHYNNHDKTPKLNPAQTELNSDEDNKIAGILSDPSSSSSSSLGPAAKHALLTHETLPKGEKEEKKKQDRIDPFTAIMLHGPIPIPSDLLQLLKERPRPVAGAESKEAGATATVVNQKDEKGRLQLGQGLETMHWTFFLAAQVALVLLLTMLFLGVLITIEFVLDREDDDLVHFKSLYWGRILGIAMATVVSAVHGSVLSGYVLLGEPSDWIAKATVGAIVVYWASMTWLMSRIMGPLPY